MNHLWADSLYVHRLASRSGLATAILSIQALEDPSLQAPRTSVTLRNPRAALHQAVTGTEHELLLYTI